MIVIKKKGSVGFMLNKLLYMINDINENKGSSLVTEINEKTSLKDDLQFDSFDLALLTAKIEDEFDVDVFEDGIVNTVGEIIFKLENK